MIKIPCGLTAERKVVLLIESVMTRNMAFMKSTYQIILKGL